MIADIDERFQGALGLGGYQTHTPQGHVTATAQAPMKATLIFSFAEAACARKERVETGAGVGEVDGEPVAVLDLPRFVSETLLDPGER